MLNNIAAYKIEYSLKYCEMKSKMITKLMPELLFTSDRRLRKQKKNELSPHIELYPMKVFPSFVHLNKSSRIHYGHLYTHLDRAKSDSKMSQILPIPERELTGTDKHPKIKRNNSNNFSKISSMQKHLVN
jgi:hypothetical protein